MSDEIFWKLVARKLSGDAGSDELRELESMLRNDPEKERLNIILQSVLEMRGDAGEETDPEWSFEQHMERMNRIEKRTRSVEHLVREQVNNRRPLLRRLLNQPGMVANYFKVIGRNLIRNKGFSAINILGLATGMASAILIFLLVQNEMSFDDFHKQKDRIYLLHSRTKVDGKIESWSTTPMPLAPVLKADYPQVEDVCRLNGTGPFVLTVKDKHLEAAGHIADPSFFRIMSFPFVEGNAQTALNSPRSIVVTQKFARKIFGHTDVMGEVIRIDSNAYFQVSGILKDIPGNSSLNFDYVVPWSYMKEVGWENLDWGNTGILTIVLLRRGVTQQWADSRFRNIVKAHAPTVDNELFLHPLAKWRLYSHFENGKIAGGQIDVVRLFSLIGIFILLIACINYMNLSTARSIKRAREVGIRKVVGAGKFSLVLRFLSESILVSALAGLLAIVIAHIGLDRFNWLTTNELIMPYHDLRFWLLLGVFVLITGLIAGSYPAFYLSTFQPITVLKGILKNGSNLVTVRKVLVVLQFSFATTFIICTIVIHRQIEFGSRRDPGYDRDHLAFVYVKGDMNKYYPAIRTELLQSGAVTAVTRSNSPISYTWSDDLYTWPGSRPDVKTYFSEFHTDNDFVSTMGLKILSGRDIDTRIYPTDSNAVLLNESAVQAMGVRSPVGLTLRSGKNKWVVVGVVKNFIASSPLYAVSPTILQGPKNWFGTISFRLSDQHDKQANDLKIESIFRKYAPQYPFVSRFVDAADAEKLEGERRIAIQSSLFSSLAIFISCLGLFALAAYTAENRIKEIGVRKVLGASVSGIMLLLSKDFLKLIFISYLIASPVAWWAMHVWLSSYTYRVSIGWSVFAVTGLLSLGIALATISYQAAKAALSNAVISLRAE